MPYIRPTAAGRKDPEGFYPIMVVQVLALVGETRAHGGNGVPARPDIVLLSVCDWRLR